jgi:hypothetical protein
VKSFRILAVVGLIGVMGLFLADQAAIRKQLKALSDGAEAPAVASASRPVSGEQAELKEALEKLAAAQSELAAAEAKMSGLIARAEEFERKLETIGKELERRADAMENSGMPKYALKGPGWSPEQTIGAPDTHRAGDLQTAWASREADGGHEWLKLDYAKAVDLAEVRVRETYNPGAISKVTAILPDGREAVIWEGEEPPGQAPIETVFEAPANLRAKSVKVYLDTARVPGWNEIDAVELVGRDGTRQWASQAAASSTYAEGRGEGLYLLDSYQSGGLRR